MEHLHILPKLQRPALKVHVHWCKTGIHSCDISEKVCLMYEESFPIPLLCNLKYKPSPSELAMFLLVRSANFKIPKRFLCRLPVFPNYLSVSCDYGYSKHHTHKFNLLPRQNSYNETLG